MPWTMALLTAWCGERDYVVFDILKKSAFSDSVGRKGGKQIINLATT